MKKIVGHNFSLKFKLLPGSLLPFTNTFNKKWKLPKGANNWMADFYFEKGYVRQTSKSLIVFPFLETIDAEPLNAYKLKAALAQKAFDIVEELKARFPGSLKVGGMEKWEPSTQEYAIEDNFAKSLPFSYRNELGQIDKSRHVDDSGHVFSGGEIDWFQAQLADTYIKMPLTFERGMKDFKTAMELHTVNIASHLQAVKDISFAARKQAEETQNLGQGIVELRKSLKPARKRFFRGSLKNSATARGVS